LVDAGRHALLSGRGGTHPRTSIYVVRQSRQRFALLSSREAIWVALSGAWIVNDPGNVAAGTSVGPACHRPWSGQVQTLLSVRCRPPHGRVRRDSVGARMSEDVGPVSETSATPVADLIELMETCKAIRWFKPDPVPIDLIERILRAANCAPILVRIRRLKIAFLVTQTLCPVRPRNSLRFCSPVEADGRVVTETTDFHGQRFNEGDWVLVLYGAANRDPELFDDPEEVTLTRISNQHVAFGYGIHRYLGMHLARAELIVALHHILELMPHFRLAAPEHIEWGYGEARGIRSVAVEVAVAGGFA
jgi:hypothetical protein